MSRVSGGRKLGGLFIGLLLASLLLPTGVAIGGTTSTGPDVVPLSTDGYDCSYYYPCQLVVSAPESVAAGESFGVTVTLKVGEVQTNECDGSQVVLSVIQGDTLIGEIQFEALAEGMVSFDVSIAEGGLYTLIASMNDEGCSATPGDATVEVEEEEVGITVTCPANQICTARTESQSGNAEAAVTASAGATIVAAFSTLAQADYTACGGKQPADAGGVLTFDVQNGKVIKVLEMTIDASIAGAKLKDHKICWNAPAKFKTAGGTWSPADGPNGYTGFLPDCLSRNPSLPCVLLRSKNSAGDVSLIVLAKPGDPKGYISK